MTVAPLFGRAWSGGPSARPAASTDLSTLQCDIIDAESALANAGVATRGTSAPKSFGSHAGMPAVASASISASLSPSMS